MNAVMLNVCALITAWIRNSERKAQHLYQNRVAMPIVLSSQFDKDPFFDGS
jgi:hypothetical protein